MSIQCSLFLWESTLNVFNKCWLCQVICPTVYRQITYSGSQKGYNSSILGDSACSNDLQPPGDMDSCGWEDGRWTGGKLAHSRTSGSPDSWRNPSSLPRLQEWKTVLDSSYWALPVHFEACSVHNIRDKCCAQCYCKGQNTVTTVDLKKKM